jgi:hypothetical protein
MMNGNCIQVIRIVICLLVAPASSSTLAAEKRPIDVKDVDVFSPGVIKLVRTHGQVDLARDPRIVCEKRAPVGSQLPKLICMTREEMETLKRQSEEELLEIQEAQERFNETSPYNQ